MNDVYRLTFTEAPKLRDISIDAQSSLKWCRNFMSNEESSGLFEHLMQGTYAYVSLYLCDVCRV